MDLSKMRNWPNNWTDTVIHIYTQYQSVMMDGDQDILNIIVNMVRIEIPGIILHSLTHHFTLSSNAILKLYLLSYGLVWVEK